MAEYMGQEARMLKESPLELPGMIEAEKKWKNLKGASDAFAGERHRWEFCASEVLYPDSLFFLGLNPSEPEGHLHTRFDLKGLIEYGRIFSPLRKIAKQLDCTFSYFDLFCIRSPTAEELQNKLLALLGTEDGKYFVASLIELARQAITTAQPKAIYVCNATARDILLEVGSLAKCLNKAGLSSGFFFDCPAPQEFPRSETAGKKLYYTVITLGAQPIPVILGIQLAGKFISKETREKVPHCIVSTLREALPDPTGFYRKLERGH